MTIFKRFTDNMPKISSMEDSRKTRNVTSDKGTSRVKPMSGAGMDRKVTRKNTWFKKIMLPGLVLLILGYLAYDGLSNSGKKLSVDQERVRFHQ
jgi:hypothetical protein